MESKIYLERNNLLRFYMCIYVYIYMSFRGSKRTTFGIESHTWTCEKVGAEKYENEVARSRRHQYICRLFTTVSDYKHPRSKRRTIICTEPLPLLYCHFCHYLKQLSPPELSLPKTHSKI